MHKPVPARSILVIDDEESVRLSLAMSLRQAGYNVVTNAGTFEVLDVLKTGRFDLVITDVLMPDIDVTEVIRSTKEHQRSAAILAISGGGGYMDPEFCLELAKSLGAGSRLMKPFNVSDLLAAVEKALNPSGAAKTTVH